MKPKKSPAADRTIDMFTGRSKEDETVIRFDSPEDAADAAKPTETIEEAAERWRANAFFAQEQVSKHFREAEYEGRVYRLTEKDDWFFLESFSGENGRGKWTGVMFQSKDLYEITSVFVAASRKKKESSNG